jgi:HSP20 family protein
MFTREYLPMFKGLDGYLNRFDPFRAFGMRPLIEWPAKLGANAEWQPVANVIETEHEYVVKAELPEVKKEDIKVDVADGLLTVRGERKLDVDEKKDTVHRVETYYGAFARTFALPDNVDVPKIRAEVAEGVLAVHLPKLPAAAVAQPTQIPIQ